MSKVKICVELDEAELRLYKAEAKRRGMKLEQLIENMVSGLMRDLKKEEKEGTDHPIIPS